MAGTRMVEGFEVRTQEQPTFYFVGVTTGKSSIMKVFPRWMEVLGRSEVRIEGIDHALHDTREAYRRTVAQMKYDPLSLGGLVTTHKINIAEAAWDMFDTIDPYARTTHEISCIARDPQSGMLEGYAKDPITAGLSLDALLGEGYFGRAGGFLFCIGAGGSGTSISLHLINKTDPADRPGRVVVVNRSQERLDKLQAMVAEMDSDIEFEFICNSEPEKNDKIMESLPEGSVVVNATGMGKDLPGSPITDRGLFPKNGISWEINYRGELDFWHQSMAQRESRSLLVEDGWLYFLHGWTQHIAQVLRIKMTDKVFGELAEAVEDLRPPLVYSGR